MDDQRKKGKRDDRILTELVSPSARFSQRSSSFQRSPLWQIAELARGRKDAIFLNVGEPDFKTPSHIVQAAQEAIQNGKTHYSPDRGLAELRTQIVETLKEETGAGYDPDSVVVTVGAAAANSAVLFALVDPGDEVLVPSPYYPNHVYQILMTGGKPVEVETDDGFQLKMESLEQRMSDKTKALILLSPNNPTGTVYNPKLVREIVEVCTRRNVFVISDEVYSKFVYDGCSHTSILSLTDAKKGTILVNSFSKTYAMTGWRIGYVVAESTVAERILKCHYAMNLSASSFVQSAALAALRGSQESVKRMVEEFGKRRQVAISEINRIKGVSCPIPQGAFYLFPKFRIDEITSLELAKRLASESGIVVSPGSAYGRPGEGRLRISYASDVSAIREGIARIRKFVDEMPQGSVPERA